MVTRRDGDISAAVQTARECLGLSGSLLSEPDVVGGGGVPPNGGESRAPWNAAAAYAHTGLRETVVRLEVSLLNQVEGEPQWPRVRPRRGGSDGNAAAALRSVGRLAERLEAGDADEVARILWRHCGPTEMLPAVDRVTRWVPIRTSEDRPVPACPYCRTRSLRVAEGGFAVMCFGWVRGTDEAGRVKSVPCTDWDGNRPFATLTVSELPGQLGEPVLAFRDGTVMGASGLGDGSRRWAGADDR